MNPIIYIRGYAGTSSAVERAVESPYYGFNDGSTKVRVDAKGSPSLHIFESPLIRLMKEHGFRDYFVRVESGKVILLKSTEENHYPDYSLWIFRYYDETSSEVGTNKRKRIEDLATDLAKLTDYVLEKTGAENVDLIAHSMGGLVARSLIQRTWAKTAHQKIRRLFTYGTPHGGIHFRGGLGWAEALRDLVGTNDSDTFGPKRMKQFLNLPDAKDDELHHLGNSTFKADQCFSLVGTNYRDYELAASKNAVGPGSDGLVMAQHAFIKNSNRAYVHRAHSGAYGLVNSEEGYQNLQRFLFGETAVKVSVRDIVIDKASLQLPSKVTLGRILIESRVAVRGVPVFMHHHSHEHGSALPVLAGDLKRGETIFRTFLMRSKQAAGDPGWSRFQIDIRFLPVFVRDHIVFSDKTFEGEAIFHQSIQIGVKDAAPDGSREVEWSWGSFNRSGDSTATLQTGVGTHSINFPATNGPVIAGKLVFDVQPW